MPVVIVTRTISPSRGRQVKVKKTTIWTRSARRAVAFPIMTQWPASDDVFGHVADEPAAPPPPAWARTAVVSDVPALDDVLDGTVDVAGTSRDTSKPKKTRRPGKQQRPERSERPERPSRTSRSERPERSQPAVRELVGAGGRAVGTQGRRAVRLARRRPTGVFSHRRTLVAAAVLALVAGVGAGAGVDAVRHGGEPTAAVTAAAAAAPELCAAAQVAWARAAAAQARMDLEAPATLRSGFVGARDALTAQEPPGGVTAEWTVVTDYVTAVADAVADTGDGETEAAALTAIASLDTEAMTNASERITLYLGSDCTA
jgi:hypothetical protein